MDRRRRHYADPDDDPNEDFDLDEEEVLEQQQLQRAEEIRRALVRRDETIERLTEKLKATKISLEKHKASAAKVVNDLVKCENDNVELRKTLITVEEELRVAHESEKRLRREKEKLDEKTTKLSGSENELKSLREDVKRLMANEAKLRQENKKLEERYDAEMQRTMERSTEKGRFLEQQLKQQEKRMYELESQLQAHHDRNTETELLLKERTHILADCEKQLQEESRKANEFERRFQAETKRVDVAEQRLREEVARANEAEQRLGDERVLFNAELDRLRQTISMLEDKNEKSDEHLKVVEKSWREKVDQVTRELKRKNAVVFELENQLNGALFVAERKLTRIEKEAALRVKSASKHVAEAQRQIEERERKALQALTSHTTLVRRIETLEVRLQHLFIQRDWLVSAVEEHRSLLLMVEQEFSHVQDLQATGTAPNRRSSRRGKSGLKTAVWAIMFTLLLTREKRSQTAPEGPAFVWSPMLVLVKSQEHLRTRVNAAKITWDELTHDVGNVQETKRHLKKAEVRLAKQSMSVKELRQHASYYEDQYHQLKAQLAELVASLDEMNLKEVQRETELRTLREECARLEQGKLETSDQLKANRDAMEGTVEELEKRAKKLASKIKLLQGEVEEEQYHRKLALEAVRTVEKERDHALAEARALQEMVKTVERYAEAEISSLTKMIETDRWSSALSRHPPADI